jgi:lipopolysaccharide export system protein LptA
MFTGCNHNNAKNSFTIKIVGVFIFLFFNYFFAFSQEKKKVEILEAEYAETATNDPTAQRLVGNQVKIKHKDILMWCDTAYTYSGSNKVDAFGHVHINQGDTLNLYASKIYYNGDKNFASAYDSVRLVNKGTTLYSDTIDYDLATNIGYYDNHGKIVDSTNVLTSVIGQYYVDSNLVHFYKDVHGYNENYTLDSDTLHYNTETGRIFIEGPTVIRDSSNTLYAEDGWYDSKTGEAELEKNPRVFNEKQQLTADYIKYNEENGDGNAVGSVKIQDFENNILVEGINAVYNKTSETASVTDSAVFMMYSKEDTLFMHADTLRTIPDTIEGEKVITAFYGVRFFRSDIQGVCDSLVYFTKDSVVQLYNHPVIWSEIHQLSADKIDMKQKINAPDEMHLTNNSFIISKQDSGRFDQIKGKNMIGYIVNNQLDRINVDGNGQTLYYAREDEQMIGLNRAESSNISIQLKDGKIFRIAFLKAPEGELKPMFELTEEEKKLSGFDWKIDQRPLSKFDIFRRETPEAKNEVKKPKQSEEIMAPEN